MTDEPHAKRPKSIDSGDGDAVRVIDIRSDTVTLPTKEMRQAMGEAEVGDDVYGEDPTVNRLQDEVASLLGKEAGLYVPTGTMGNLVSVMVHCNRRGDEVMLGDKSHINILEQGGIAQVGGVIPQPVRNLPDGTMDLTELEAKLKRAEMDNISLTRLVCIENTHNATGGRVIKPHYMDALAAITKKHNLKLHIDGARFLNAATALGVPPAELAKHADTVCMCLSKGLGAPVGSVVVGSREFITQARRIRRVLGGGMRQAGLLAAAGLYSLQHISKRLHIDHQNTKRLAEGLYTLKEHGISVDLEGVESNIIFFTVANKNHNATSLVKALGCPGVVNGNKVAIRAGVKGTNLIRVLVHHQVSQDDVDCVIERLRQLL